MQAASAPEACQSAPICSKQALLPSMSSRPASGRNCVLALFLAAPLKAVLTECVRACVGFVGRSAGRNQYERLASLFGRGSSDRPPLFLSGHSRAHHIQHHMEGGWQRPAPRLLYPRIRIPPTRKLYHHQAGAKSMSRSRRSRSRRSAPSHCWLPIRPSASTWTPFCMLSSRARLT